LGWSGEHLHRFVIHGGEYGISYLGGVGFRDDPYRVRVAELGLRPTERFTYHYDFAAGWCHAHRRTRPVQRRGRRSPTRSLDRLRDPGSKKIWNGMRR
jgi:hypothetical protein